jgi:hypothetical protein
LADGLNWDFAPGRAGKFLVEVVQSSPPDSDGSEVEFICGEQKLTIKVEASRSGAEFISRQVGAFTLDKGGKHTLTLRAKSKRGQEVMSVRQVALWPVEK